MNISFEGKVALVTGAARALDPLAVCGPPHCHRPLATVPVAWH
jgi:hypothetical protein